MTDWYDDNIEIPVKNLVRYLRNNGINTECSCGHQLYIQCQYIPDGTIQEIHKLLYDYLHENNQPINFEIHLHHSVVDGHSYSNLDIRLVEFEKHEKKFDKGE